MENKEEKKKEKNDFKKKLLKIGEVISFFRSGIWKVSTREIPKFQAGAIRFLRVIILAVKGYLKDNCGIRAQALTFYSMLSIVPVLAMGFGIAKGFGIEEVLENEIRTKLAGQKEVMEQSISFAKSMLETTQGGIIAGIGLILLFYTVMKLLNSIEDTFNLIWEVEKSRTFLRKFTDYLTIMLIAPVLLVISSSITVYISTQIKNITEEVELLNYVSPLIFFFLKLIPYALISILLTLIYIIMPNSKVNIKSSLIAGIVAGTCFQILQWGYIEFQVGVSRYNAIYGSFAALPLFMIWLQFSWMIILGGAEISFAIQNVKRYEYAGDEENLSTYFRRLASIMIMQLIVKRFAKGEKAFTTNQIANELKTPLFLVRDVIKDLIKCKIITEIKAEHEKDISYQPARDISTITISSIVEKIDNQGINCIPLKENEEFEKITGILNNFKENLEKSDKNLLLKDI